MITKRLHACALAPLFVRNLVLTCAHNSSVFFNAKIKVKLVLFCTRKIVLAVIYEA